MLALGREHYQRADREHEAGTKVPRAFHGRDDRRHLRAHLCGSGTRSRNRSRKGNQDGYSNGRQPSKLFDYWDLGGNEVQIDLDRLFLCNIICCGRGLQMDGKPFVFRGRTSRNATVRIFR